MSAGPARAGRAGSSRTAALLVLAVGGAVALLSSVQTWVRLTAADTLGEISVAVAGAALAPLAPAAAVVGLAAVPAVPAVRGWLRRGVGALVLVLALAAAASVATSMVDLGARAQQWWRLDVGALALTAAADVSRWWPWATLLGLVAVVVGAAVVLARGGRWVGMSARYERVDRAPADTSGPDGSRQQTDADVWQALDRGEDPTAS
jgi:uncharacterized membrane protein (TIGR02234 family)